MMVIPTIVKSPPKDNRFTIYILIYNNKSFRLIFCKRFVMKMALVSPGAGAYLFESYLDMWFTLVPKILNLGMANKIKTIPDLYSMFAELNRESMKDKLGLGDFAKWIVFSSFDYFDRYDTIISDYALREYFSTGIEEEIDESYEDIKDGHL